MKKAPFFMAASLLMACAGSAQETAPGALDDLFTVIDAEKILGQPAHLADSSTTREGDVVLYRCTYKADIEEVGTRKLGAIYFLVEEHDRIPSAQEKYSFIKTANEDHAGIDVLDDVGDEAYFHSDGENFCFIMVRKGPRVLTMKVNKLTRATSLDAFNAVARRITAAL